MVVDEPGCLHVGVRDRRTNELKSSLFQILAQAIGFGARRDEVRAFAQNVDPRLAFDERPDIVAKTIIGLLHFEKSPCVADGCFDFQAVADQSFIP